MPRRDRERHPRSQVRRGAQPSTLGALRRQRRLAGRPEPGPQPGPLDRPHRSGRADRHHQDPQATHLFPARTAHPQGPPPHPAPSPTLALAKPLQQRPGPIARPAATFLTTPAAPDRSPGIPQLPGGPAPGRVSSVSRGNLARLSRPQPPLGAVNLPLMWLPHPAPIPIRRSRSRAGHSHRL